LVWLILDPIKLVKYGVFILKVMATLPCIYLIILHGTKVVKNEMTHHFNVSHHHVSVHLNTLVFVMVPTQVNIVTIKKIGTIFIATIYP